MSKSICSRRAFHLTQFYGGKKKGISIQITDRRLEPQNVQFNIKEIKQLVKALNKWCRKHDLNEEVKKC